MQSMTTRFNRVSLLLAAAGCAGLAHADFQFECTTSAADRCPAGTYDCATIESRDAVSGTPARNTNLTGINQAGLAVGWANFPTLGRHVNFVYDTRTKACTPVADPTVPPDVDADAFDVYAINDAGTIVGAAFEAPGSTADPILGYVQRTKGAKSFEHPDFARTFPRGIGNTGIVTGFANNDDNVLDERVGFIYDPERDSHEDITFTWGERVIAQGVNGRGQVVGSVRFPAAGAGGACASCTRGNFGFLRDSRGSRVFKTLFRVSIGDNDQPTSARGINDTGLITGFITDFDGVTLKGFVARLPGLSAYQPVKDGVQLIAIDGALGTIPAAIDNSGRVVGTWSYPAGYNHGFIATPKKK